MNVIKTFSWIFSLTSRIAGENVATSQQLGSSMGGRGLHWDELDEDLSVAGLMAGADWRNA